MKAVLASLAITVALWLSSFFWQGYLGAIIWRWFAVGIFHLPTITRWQAVAVIILLHFFLPTQVLENEKERDWIEQAAHGFSVVAIYGFLAPLMTFASAWIVWRFFL